MFFPFRSGLESRLPRLLLLAFVTVSLGGCDLLMPKVGTGGHRVVRTQTEVVASSEEIGQAKGVPGEGEKGAAGTGEQFEAQVEPTGPTVNLGTGVFLQPPEGKPAGAAEAKGDITLNFENTDIREVVKIVLGDTLGLNYILDPAVRGGVTMQTGKPIARQDLLSTLETLLRMNGAALVKVEGIFHVLPVAKAFKGTTTPQLADSANPLPEGFSVLLRPLEFVSAQEMNKILEPLILDSSVVRVDTKRNMLILSGTERELRQMEEVIRTFDVDWMQGLSVGFFPLQNSKVADIKQSLDAVLGGEEGEGLEGMVRITPIESANGLLVVSSRPYYLDKMGKLIERLDSMSASAGEERLFVYRVKNGDAETLADLLGQLFKSEGAKPKEKAAAVAPGLQPAKVASKTAPAAEGGAKAPAPAAKAAARPVVGSVAGSLESEIRVVADTTNNSLLIMALPRDYERIKRVLADLDIVPLQVHIEATIVEVLLDGDLEYGVQWFFKGGGPGNKTSTGILDGVIDSGSSSGLGGIFPGFNWSLIDSAGQIRAVLSAFAGDSRINVLSAPSVMVLDNHEAKIRVGDEVPIVTTQQQGTTTDSRIINSIQYRETGVILNVKPRVAPGGLVTMEITQEVSSVDTAASSSSDSPTILTREIQSTVAVQNGETVVLGGLIRDQSSQSQGGVPGLYKVPVVGALFGETTRSANRTELVVVLTPRVIANQADAVRITEDFRTKLEGLKGEF